jgi:hypothetical protein
MAEITTQERTMREHMASADGLIDRLGKRMSEVDHVHLKCLISLFEEMLSQRGEYDWRTITVLRSLTYFWTGCERKYEKILNEGSSTHPHISGF